MRDTNQLQGQGLASLRDCGALSTWQAATPVPAVIIHPDNFLASPDVAAGPLLAECQAAFDLRLVEACAAKLARSMANDGREDARAVIGSAFPKSWKVGKQGKQRERKLSNWPAQWRDAVAAGLLAVQQWRNRVPGVNVWEPVERVAWRGVVEAISRDTLGDGQVILTPGDDWLWQAAESLPCESEDERLARQWRERANKSEPVTLAQDFEVNIGAAAARAAAARSEAHPGKLVIPAHAPGAAIVIPAGTVIQGRITRLQRRIESIMAGKRRRADAVERVGRACVFLLQGETLDKAATLAGFKATGKGRHTVRAGDSLARAMQKLGVRFVRDARERDGWDGDLDRLKVSIALAEGRGFSGFVPVQQDAHVQAWADWLTAPADAHVQAWFVQLANRGVEDERLAVWLGSPDAIAARLSVARALRVGRARLRAWRRSRARS